MSVPSDSPAELSAPFSGARIDRAAGLRHHPEELHRLLSRPQTRAVFADDGHVLVDPAGTRLLRAPWSGDPGRAVVLGLEDGSPLIGVELTSADRSPAGTRLSLREAGLALADGDGGLAAYLVALLNWHRRHPFCSVCGQATDLAEAGLSRRCPACGATHFPRTDPVVIMTVEWEDHLLMGSRRGWDAHRFSILAGFVGTAETPEEAVLREVEEESHITARDPRYVFSQPWPFPASLMLGFHARCDGGDPVPGDDDELSEVRWFPREEVAAMAAGKSDLVLPGPVSIARRLINAWLAG